jgi:natural product biosynthesis luciferase-like monooxygenase protein/amino acid adenylation domain-containing protein
MSHSALSDHSNEIAIIGMAGRFPGAKDLEQFWKNLCDGVESISFFTAEELVAAGVEPFRLNNPAYIKAGGALDGIDLFDAEFFAINPREAEVTGPQQRLFLECAWEALENAGYDAERYRGAIGVFAGAATSNYWMNLASDQDLMSSVAQQIIYGNDKDYLATLVSYKMNLRGPSVTVQTACSTSLVAVHLACQSLLNGECDMALAGGSKVRARQVEGYYYREGGIGSPDGHCRAFDAEAAGTVGGNGVGVVVLKRVTDALQDGDTVRAVIKGSAINNDGSIKIGYTAPSVQGQASVISEALALARVRPEDITYIEAHGTGTRLGDPIEIKALTLAFREALHKKGFCAIGSVKTSIGHLDVAAGIAGLIKAVLALEHGVLPPSLNCSRPNPLLDLENTPFFVNTTLTPWSSNGSLRRAGVSSFGIGGTNAHVILEEAQQEEAAPPPRQHHLLILSARTGSAIEMATRRLRDHLQQNPTLPLPDVAYTLQVGRRSFSHRRCLICVDLPDAIEALGSADAQRILDGQADASPPHVAFMFSGQGTQRLYMGRDIYQAESCFRQWVDEGAGLLESDLGLDLRRLLYPASGQESTAAILLRETRLAQPALFVIEYALAKWLMNCGVSPAAMIGHSLGEYVAACIAGVFTFAEALRLLVERGRLMQRLPPGGMLAVQLDEEEITARLGPGLWLAAVNGARQCVVSGTPAAIDELTERLQGDGIFTKRLQTGHAFHSGMMQGMLEAYEGVLRDIRLQPPTLPFLSNVTGEWIRSEEACDTNYWLRQVREPVRFGAGLRLLAQDPALILLEVGPGETLCALARMQLQQALVLPTLGKAPGQHREAERLYETLGHLWLRGTEVDWQAIYEKERRRRVRLPSYPFQRERYWIERRHTRSQNRRSQKANPSGRRDDPADWFYVPLWRQTAVPRPVQGPQSSEKGIHWLVFEGGDTVSRGVCKRLAEAGARVSRVQLGERFEERGEGCYQIDPGRGKDYLELLETLQIRGEHPERIAHLWSLQASAEDLEGEAAFARAQDLGFHSLLHLTRALAEPRFSIQTHGFSAELPIIVVSQGVQEVTGEEILRPEHAPLLGLCKVITHEYPRLICRTIDTATPATKHPHEEQLICQVAEELSSSRREGVVAYRGRHRWVQEFQAVRVEPDQGGARTLRRQGVYMITGGLGRVQMELASCLCREVQAKVVLVGRRNLLSDKQSEPDPRSATPKTLELLGEIKRIGSEVSIEAADAEDYEAMTEVVRKVKARWGRIDGVIHLAGMSLDGSFRRIAETDCTESQAQVRSTALEVRVLERVLDGQELDFCLLMSSLAGVLGAVGSVVPAAASHFLNAFTRAHNLHAKQPWTSVNWQRWAISENVGDVGCGVGDETAHPWMTPGEAAQAFGRVLELTATAQVLVSTADLETQLDEWNNRKVAGEELQNTEVARKHRRPALESLYEKPGDEIEQQVVGIWEELLGIESIGMKDNFFELGGHSLLATQVLSRMRSKLGIEVPLRSLFEQPTVRGLTEVIREGIRSGAVAEGKQILRAPRDGALPLSFAQQRLWFIQQLEPESVAYNIPHATRLRGRLEISALRQGLGQIANRHQVLRTRFESRDGRQVQVISEASCVPFPVCDLSDLPDYVREQRARQIAAEDAARHFDLRQGPVWRAALVRLAPEENVLLLCIHHVASDGWSTGILIKELSLLYEGYREGSDVSLPDLPVQYADFAAWQREWLQGEVLENQMDYWRRQLTGVLTLELPTDHPRPAVASHRGGALPFRLPRRLTDDLNVLSRRQGVTLFMTLLAGFEILLGRYARQEDVVVGTNVANRNRLETEGLIGFFINQLVLRTDLSGNPRFREILRRVRETTLGAYSHQDIPFEKVVEELAPERDLARSPLFQVVFALQNAPERDLRVGGVEFGAFGGGHGVAKFDLMLNLMERKDGVGGVLEYATDLFDRITIERLNGHLRQVFEEIVASPEGRISELTFLTGAESQQMLVEWNDTEHQHQKDIRVHELFERQVEHTSEAVAVVYQDQQLSYAALNHAANQLAHHLARLGVGAEIRVALCMERSFEMVIGLLGVLKAGGAYVPMDPSYPQERLAYMLEDSEAPVLLTQNQLMPDLPDYSGKPICLDQAWLQNAGSSPDNPKIDVSPHALAYVIYTSGSTGMPKGVAIEHHNTVNLLRWAREVLTAKDMDAVLASTSISFDLSVFEMFLPLSCGGTVILVENLLDLPTTPASQRVSLINTVPSAMEQLLRNFGIPQSVQTVNLAGEALWGRLVEEIREANADATVFNLYGPSEDTTYSTFGLMGREGEETPSIGRAIAATQVYVLSNDCQPVPIGVPGELFIGGEGVARGYLNKPNLTTDKFMPDSFSGNPGARLYRTGDQARWGTYGELDYLGRLDQQVKLRGYRIELGEIEAVLSLHAGVRQCAVTVREDVPGDKRLVGYIVPSEEAAPATAELRGYLQGKLPEHMVPSAFVALPQLPLTSNGKLDRKALPHPQVQDVQVQEEEPRSPVEEIVAAIWCQVLGLDRVGMNQNFFDLGGHSLLATQIISRIREVLEVEVPLRAVFEAPTLGAMAEAVERDRAIGTPLEAPPMKQVSREEDLPLSFAQQRLWFIQQLEPESVAYNIPHATRLRGGLEISALRQCLGEIANRHQVLRTRFEWRGEQPVQVVAESCYLPLAVWDLSDLAENEREQRVGQIAGEDTARPFDLRLGPVWRAGVVRLGAEENVLLLCIHHVASDGWSTGILIKELSQLYEGYREGSEVFLGDLPVQYTDFAAWQRGWLQGEVLDRQMEYWRRQLAGVPVLELPTDHPRPAVASHRGASMSFTISPRLTGELTALSRRQGVTLFMTLLAGFQVLLSRYSGQQDVAVGMAIAGRNRAETEGLVGLFVNTLVIRTEFSGNPTVAELLARLRETTLLAYGHQDLPFERLVEELQPERSLSHEPLFQVMFMFQNAPRTTTKLSDLRIGYEPTRVDTAKFDMTLMLVEEEGIRGALEYATDLYDRDKVVRLLEHLRRIMERLAAEDGRLMDAPLTTEQEEKQILGWNSTAVDYPKEMCAHQLFEEYVDCSPDAVAVVFDDRALSYYELNKTANQLARHLRRMGVGPELRVAICIERGIEMVAGLLGVLKAGAAYVPLDPQYPIERLLFILSDASIKVLVTQQHLSDLFPPDSVEKVLVDRDWPAIGSELGGNLCHSVTPGNLAYVIYTSGSTGKPKGVMVQHYNMVNFFSGMDSVLGAEPAETWLAVTSISFDISVLELLWTLSRGFRVVIHSDPLKEYRNDGFPSATPERGMEFSLFYFANDYAHSGQGIYELLIEGAKFADEHGFSAVWSPERHFHPFGGIYPNPSVASAALATITKRVHLRAGSVVLPLHDPVRVAEEWAIVDNLSNGRVGLSFASGWHADDFVLMPDVYNDRHEVMLRNIDVIRKLWRGESVTRRSGAGNPVQVAIFPRPIQPDLPIWVTSAGTPRTFQAAGEIGANVLTHLLGQSIEELEQKIHLYREAWREHGHGPGAGHVTLMVHTFVGTDLETVRTTVRGPFTDYLRSAIGLIKNLARSSGRDYSQGFTEDDLQSLLDHAFNRYFDTNAMMGTLSSCMKMVDRLKAAGVDELGCLIDFGVDTESVLSGLRHLSVLRERCNVRRGEPSEASISAQIAKHGITHLQCTPSLARVLTFETKPLNGLNSLKRLIIGGEALPATLTRELGQVSPATIRNMYGPTETSIWSTSWLINDVDDIVPIGRPIANTQIRFLDQQFRQVPMGLPGELCIGGDGVARGYLERPELTAERFIPDEFGDAKGLRSYRTGDVASYLADGNIQYLGRADHQVKIRGHRVELGEIESVLLQHPVVEQSVVVMHENEPGDQRLVAYIVAKDRSRIGELRGFLETKLPGYLMPSSFVELSELPLTPNRKVDRKALATLSIAKTSDDIEEPLTTVQEIVAGICADVLQVERISRHQNFFELGGHSLLATRVISRLREAFRVELPLRALFESPTVAGLAEAVGQKRNAGASVETPAIRPVSRDADLPLSFGQQRLWFVHQLDPDSSAYNQSYALRLDGTIAVSGLYQSIREIVRRHEVLRTRFAALAEQPVQMIDDPGEFDLTVWDVSGLSEVERDEWTRRITRLLADRPFDLERGPVWRSGLVRAESKVNNLLLVTHHIVSDGRWSMDILLREVSSLYDWYREGERSILPDLPVQYADFAVWQREWLRGDPLRQQLGYWKQQLAEATALDLPAARPGHRSTRRQAAEVRFRLLPELVKELRALSQREGVTLFMTLLAAFQILLGRYARKEDILVGIDVANRNRLETERLIGFFVNQLVLRTDLSGNPSFRRLLSRVRETTLDAHAHQDVPFEKLVEELAPERDMGRTPLFQVAFAFQGAARVSARRTDLKLTPFGQESKGVRFDLELLMEEGERGLGAAMVYNAELFEQDTIARMGMHLERLLACIVREADRGIAGLSMLTPEEEWHLTEEWNDTGVEYSEKLCIEQVFDAQVYRSPDSIAASDRWQCLTYRELDRRASAAARILATKGVKPEIAVGVLVDRGIDLLVSMVAIFKAGGVYVPLDPLYPPHRLRKVILLSGSRVILSNRKLEDRNASLRQQAVFGESVVLLIEDLMNLVVDEGCIAPATCPRNLAYVIYTSGSTGAPKGAMIEHKGMLNHWYAKIDDLSLCDGDTIAETASQCFDISIWQLLAALMVGGRVHIIADEDTHTPSRLLNAVRENQVTVLETVPSMLRSVLDETEGISAREAILPALRVLLVTGETLPVELCCSWIEKYPHIPLVNAYGPTECSDDVTHHFVETTAGNAETLVPIGRALRNTKTYVLDRDSRLLPIGMEGELYVGGAGVGRGYLLDSTKTAECFVPGGYGSEFGSRVYATGDRVRNGRNGRIGFLGRIDHQVKMRGFRIELGEIERVLKRHESISESAVVMRGFGPGDDRLVAYMVVKPGYGRHNGRRTTTELRGFLQETLPAYMIPSAFVVVEKMPLTPNGKVDRKSLPTPTELYESSDAAESLTPIQEIISGIWARVLRVEQVGIGQNFFELGGHSLLATQVMSRIRQVLAVEIPLRVLFENPSVAGLAQAVELEQTASRRSIAPAIKPVGRDQELPLSYAQQRLWFIHQLEPDSAAYNIPLGLRIHGAIAAEVLQQSFEQILSRHEALRTTFGTRNGRSFQIIRTMERLSLPVLDFTGLERDIREQETRKIVVREVGRPFDLKRGPAWRTILIRFNPEEHVLLVCIHHMASDGWSTVILVKEFTAIYEAYRNGERPQLPDLPVQYADFAVWQRHWLQGDMLEEQLAYWRRRLDGISTLKLQTAGGRPDATSQLNPNVGFRLSAELSNDLKELARREGVTIFMVLLAAFQMLLGRRAGQEDVVVGTSIANRNWLETEGLIGFFVNQLVLRGDLSGNPTFVEMLRRARETTLGAYAHQDIPFERLVEELAPSRDLSQTPLFQVKLVFQNAPRERSNSLTGLKLETFLDADQGAKFNLMLMVTETEDRLAGHFSYSPAIFSRAYVEQLSVELGELLAIAAVRCDQSIVSLGEELDEFTEQYRAARMALLNKTLEYSLSDSPRSRTAFLTDAH